MKARRQTDWRFPRIITPSPEQGSFCASLLIVIAALNSLQFTASGNLCIKHCRPAEDFMSTSSHKQSIHVRNSNSDVILFCNVLVRCKVVLNTY